MKKRFIALKAKEKVNFICMSMITVLTIGFSIYSFFSPKFSAEMLLSIIIFVLGVLCVQFMFEKYFNLKNIEDSFESFISAYSGQADRENIVELSTRHAIENSHPLEDRFQNAKRICMFSHSNYAIFQPQYISYVIDGIKAGTKFQFIGFNPDDVEKVNNLKKYKMVQQMDENPSRTSIENYLKIKNSNSFLDEQLQYNVCDIDFPFGMTIVYKNDGEITVKVDLYTIKTRHLDRKCMFLSSKNSGQKDLINFFISQWDEAWKESKVSSIEKKNPCSKQGFK